MERKVFLAFAILLSGFTCANGLNAINDPVMNPCIQRPYLAGCGANGSAAPQRVYKVPNRWGAIYLNPANLAVGYSENNTIGYRSANKEALENCIRDGGGKNPIGESGKGCQLMTEYRNKCGAIAIGGVVGNGWAAAKNADSIDEAERLALTACSKHSKSCKIHYSGCSRHPDYLRY